MVVLDPEVVFDNVTMFDNNGAFLPSFSPFLRLSLGKILL